MVSTFIWRHKKPCISMAVLKQISQEGGLAVPDISLYYHAAVLQFMMQLCKSQNNLS